MRRISIVFLLIASLTVAGAAPAGAQPRTVDCGAGESLQAAINTASSETPLEVLGTCLERVVIAAPTTIIGGEPEATIDGSGAPGNTVTIESDAVFIRNLTIRGAEKSVTIPDESGHGVYAAAAYTFSLLGVSVEHNEGSGVLMYDSYLTITQSRIRRNGDDGIALLGGCCGIVGADSIRVNRNGRGGIFTAGDQSLVLTNSKVKHNGGYGVFTNEDGYISDSVIRHNAGGVGSFGTGRILRSRIVDNGAWGVDEYEEIFDSTVARNGSGGIRCYQCTVSGARVRYNGGPGLVATVAEIVDSTIARNGGSGVIADDVTIERSLITRNMGTSAGAVAVGSGTAKVINSTVRKNSASAGAAFDIAGTLDVASSTIFSNSGADGVFANGGTVTVTGSIVHAHQGAAADCTGNAISSGGYNVVTAPGCAWIAADIVGEPLLLPLSNNGGPTLTHALSPGSPAVDAVPAAACTVVVDQRGEPRPTGTGCDSGAFEVQ